MRKILFKARRVDNGEWVEGFYAVNSAGVHIIITKEPFGIYEVDPDTLCQYTGLTDKNGVKIFEGDILQTKYERLCQLVWFEPKACWDLSPVDSLENIDLKSPDKWDMWHSFNLEVIGNIHDKEHNNG